jgi:hypothetical protein
MTGSNDRERLITDLRFAHPFAGFLVARLKQHVKQIAAFLTARTPSPDHSVDDFVK